MLAAVELILGENVVVTTIITFGTIISAFLGYLGVVATGARRHAKAARFEVQNSHDTNLRDDLDKKFEGLAGLVESLARDVGGIKADIRGIRTDATNDRAAAGEALSAERERILILERTLTPAQLQRLRNENKE
jgi:hypothetical protein